MAKHALIAPSSCGRIGYCPASVLLTKDLPEDSSAYAEEGTAAHRLAELALIGLFDGDREATAEEAEEITALCEKYPDAPTHVKTYVEHVQGLLSEETLERAVEARLPLEPITGEKDAFGTADCLLINGTTLHIVDLKYGAGVLVEAKENVQLCMYALAALSQYDEGGFLYGIDNVVLHIVQPRMDNISAWEISRANLEGPFLTKMRASIERALHLVEHPDELEEGFPFLLGKGDFALPTEDVCRFCRAKATCPAMRRVTIDALEQDFDALDEAQPVHADGRAELAPAEVVRTLEAIPVPESPEQTAAAFQWLKVIRTWCDAVEGRAFSLLDAGHDVPGLKLVAGRPGIRKWTDAKAAEEVIRKAVKVDLAYEKKLISPTTAEKLFKSGDIGPRYWKSLSNLINRGEGKPIIVPADDKRPALTPRIENDFEDLEGKAE